MFAWGHSAQQSIFIGYLITQVLLLLITSLIAFSYIQPSLWCWIAVAVSTVFFGWSLKSCTLWFIRFTYIYEIAVRQRLRLNSAFIIIRKQNSARRRGLECTYSLIFGALMVEQSKFLFCWYVSVVAFDSCIRLWVVSVVIGGDCTSVQECTGVSAIF